MPPQKKIEPQFRKAKKADTNILKTLIREYYRFDRQQVSNEKIASSLNFALQDNPYVSIWLIEVADNVAGYLVIAIGFTIEAGGKDGFLDELFLRAPFRGSGVGHKAIEFAISLCPTLEIQRLSLEVETHNTKARRLYEDIGFFAHDRLLMSYWIT